MIGNKNDCLACFFIYVAVCISQWQQQIHLSEQLFAKDKQDRFLDKLVYQATAIKKVMPEHQEMLHMVTLTIYFSDLNNVFAVNLFTYNVL